MVPANVGTASTGRSPGFEMESAAALGALQVALQAAGREFIAIPPTDAAQSCTVGGIRTTEPATGVFFVLGLQLPGEGLIRLVGDHRETIHSDVSNALTGFVDREAKATTDLLALAVR